MSLGRKRNKEINVRHSKAPKRKSDQECGRWELN